MITLYNIFIVLLWVIDIFGFLFGFFWLLTNADRLGRVGLVLFGLWICFYVGMGSAFLFSGYTNERTYSMVFIFSTIAITISSIIVAYAAKLGEEYLERSVRLNNKVVLFLRVIVLAVGGICIAVVGASIKSLSYHNGYSKYTFGKELSVVIENDSLKQVRPYVKHVLFLKDFKRLIEQVDPKEVFVEEGFSLWHIFNHERRMIPKRKRNVEYKFKIFHIPTAATKNVYIPSSTILEIDADRVILGYGMSPIIIKEFPAILENEIEQRQNVIRDIKSRPVSSDVFAFGSFLTILGAGDFIQSADGSSKKLDSYLLWFTYILTGFIFYVQIKEKTQ